MSGEIKSDIKRTYAYASGGFVRKVLACARMPGVQAVVVYRFGQWAKQQVIVFRFFLDPLYLILNFLIQAVWGIELPREARIGKGLYIGHFGGITISRLAVIGENCSLSQGVTIGISGHGEKRGAPLIGDNVYVAPGARIFGKIVVGNNVQIGANAVIYKNIPDNATAVLDPGFKIIERGAASEAVTASAEIA